jgi:MFS family permease
MKRGLIGLLVASAVSMVGSRMSLVALPWFVLAGTGSGAKTGIVAAAEMLAYVVACGLGGPLLDRAGHKRASVVADVVSAAAVVAVALLGMHFTLLVGLVAVAGGMRGFGDTAKRVLFREAVDLSGVNTTRATSINDGISRLATLLGAPFAGVLIAAFDAPTVLVIDAGTFLFGAVMVALFLRAQARAATDAPEPYFEALRGGVAFLRRERLIAGMLLVFFATNLFDSAYGSVLIPLWANEVIGSPVALGLVSASFAAGAVGGNAVFTAVATRVPRFLTLAVGFVIGGAPRYLVAALVPVPWPLYLVSFLAGVGMASVNPIMSAFLFERIPAHVQARVQGLGTALSWGGIPLGALLGGWLGEWNLTAAFVVFGLCYLVVTLIPFAVGSWREIDVPATSARPEPKPVPAT